MLMPKRVKYRNVYSAEICVERQKVEQLLNLVSMVYKQLKQHGSQTAN